MEYVKINDAFKISKGKKVEQIEEHSEELIRYIQIDDLRNNKNIKFCDGHDKYVYASKDDIIIAWDGANAGMVNYGLEGAIGSTLAVLKRTSNELLSEYVGKFLQSKFLYLKETRTGATIPHIQKAVLINLKIPKFDLTIQRKIVNTLDKATELIQKRQQQIQALNDFAQSIFYDMFGDVVENTKNFTVKKLNELTNVGSSRRVFTNEFVSAGIPFLRSTEIGKLSENKNMAPTFFITKKRFKELKDITGVPQVGDILIPAICQNGQSWVVNIDEDFYFKDSRIWWIKSNPQKFNSHYLRFMLEKKIVRDYMKLTSGTTFAELKIFVLRELDVSLPPLELQNEFAKIIQKIELEKELLENNLVELEINFNALMQKSFNNQLF